MQSTSTILLAEIQKKREKMIDSAAKSGFTSETTIKYSQELDELIYEYQCTFRHGQELEDDVKFVYNKSIILWPEYYPKKIESMSII